MYQKRLSNNIIDLIFKNIILFKNNKNSNALSSSHFSLLSKIFIYGRSEIYLLKFLEENQIIEFNTSNLKDLSDQRSVKSLKSIQELLKLSKVLNENKIDFIPLKGAQLILFYYRNLSLRPIRDIDILVKKEEISKIIEILFDQGFSFKDKKTLKGFDQKNFNDNKYSLLPMYNKHGVCIEIHYKIFDQTTCSLSNQLWEDSVNISLGKTKLNKISPELLSLHLIYHSISKQGIDVGIQSIIDLSLLFSKSDFSMERLISNARAHNLYEETCLYIRIFIKFNLLDSSHIREKKIKKFNNKDLDECARLMLLNSANNNSLKLFRFNFFKLVKKNFKKDILESESYNRNKKFFYTRTFIKRIARHSIRYIPLVFRLLFDRAFYYDNISTAKILKKVKK